MRDNTGLGDAIAAKMDQILKSAEHKMLFGKFASSVVS